MDRRRARRVRRHQRGGGGGGTYWRARTPLSSCTADWPLSATVQVHWFNRRAYSMPSGNRGSVLGPPAATGSTLNTNSSPTSYSPSANVLRFAAGVPGRHGKRPAVEPVD